MKKKNTKRSQHVNKLIGFFTDYAQKSPGTLLWSKRVVQPKLDLSFLKVSDCGLSATSIRISIVMRPKKQLQLAETARKDFIGNLVFAWKGSHVAST